MSNYKLNAIYKQRLRCRLRSSNKYRTNTCLCSHCWVRNVTHQSVLKNRADMKNIKTKMCCDEFDKQINKVIINNELSVPLPPPLPLTVGLLVENKHKYYKSESVADEIKRLWKNREFSIYGEEIPSEFSFTKIDSILQEGPNCGLAALAMAASATPRKLTMEELFADAKNQGFTSQGEMFSASNMAQLAKSVVQPWVNVELLTDGLSANYDYVLRSLFEGALMLVPYDASGNYAPCCKNGHKSHWAIICGVAKVKGGDPDCYVFARQGKSKYLGLWSFEQLEASNNNLTEFDPKRATDGSTYILPDGGVGVGLAQKLILLHLVHRRPDFSSYLELV